MTKFPTIDDRTARRLALDLRHAVEGEIRFEPADRALYATDGSNYRQTPIGVVIPKTIDDVIATVALCRQYQAPVLPRGGGTSLAGQCCNVAVVIDMSKHLTRILEIDPKKRIARVEPGCVLDHLRNAAEKHHLTFGPDPSTHDHNTLGGMIGNNSCGVHSVMAGRTIDNVISLDVLTYDGQRLTVGATDDADLARLAAASGRIGQIYDGLKELRERYADRIRERYPKIPRRVSGYSLDALLPESGFNVAQALVGSEGTCVFVLGAELRLVPSPPKRALVIMGFNDVYSAGDAVPRVLKFRPIGLEGMDEVLIEDMRKRALNVDYLHLLPKGRGWLIAEFGGESRQEASDAARRLEAEFAGHGGGALDSRVVVDESEQAGIWKVRKAGLGATADVPGEAKAWEGWEDAAVPPDQVGAYLREFHALLERYGYHSSLYGHFGDGCIHVRINFDLTSNAGIEKYRGFTEAAADLVLRHHGSFSGEHGDGQSRGELLPKMFGADLIEAFRTFKALWDPQWRMNPGKKIDPYRRDENLRLGAAYRPPSLTTEFAYAEDKHDFAEATLRCVGIGECRRDTGGVMCPSYRATREEKYSTRGRARLLFEMVNGGVLKDGWREHAVHDALDLCLACKGCKQDCPVNVDMATYKAEFNAHYFAHRLRPREAYSMGLIHRWARAASLMPGLANFVLQTPGLTHVAKFAGGIAQAREMPRFASPTFREWFVRRGARGTGKQVILFADTFNNYFYPQTAIAAVEVLEAAGYSVTVPTAPLCCGRPLYAWGMIKTARKLLRRVLDTLGDSINRGTPVIGLEPACLSTFQDELLRLFPRDANANRLAKQTFMLSEFLARDDNYRPTSLDRRAQVHFHCHHHAIFGENRSKKFFEKLGLDFSMMNAGCCGMAGAFGFEAPHYSVSMDVGEKELLPRIRRAAPDTLIVTNGFSCREQIRQATNRTPLHFAELARLALETSSVPASASARKLETAQ